MLKKLCLQLLSNDNEKFLVDFIYWICYNELKTKEIPYKENHNENYNCKL